MKVESINDSRFRVAIEFLKENQALNFNGVHFSLNREKRLVEVGSESSWTNRITPESARSDIQRGIDTFEYLLEHSSDFAETVNGFTPRYSVILDDGMVTAEIAFLPNDKIVFVGDDPTNHDVA